MTAATPPTTDSVWTADDERAYTRRQRLNAAAVTFSSVLSASAVVLGAILSVIALTGGGSSEVPTAPVDPLAMEITSESISGVTYENERVAAIAEPALAEIRYPWRSELQGWTIAFLEPRGRASGYTWSAEQRMEVFVRTGDDIDRVARVLAHEIGHAIDVTLNTPDERRAWLAERGVPADTPWWPTSGSPDFETGAGDFAEVFAASQVGEDDFKSRVESSIDDGDYALLASLWLRE